MTTEAEPVGMTVADAELIKAFSEMKDAAQPNILRSGLRSAARAVVVDARSRVPVDTGALRKSINLKVDRTFDRKSFIATVGYGKDQYYGAFYELGMTRKGIFYPARPFLMPALRAKEAAIPKLVFDGIKKRIDKIVAKAKAATG